MCTCRVVASCNGIRTVFNCMVDMDPYSEAVQEVIDTLRRRSLLLLRVLLCFSYVVFSLSERALSHFYSAHSLSLTHTLLSPRLACLYIQALVVAVLYLLNNGETRQFVTSRDIRLLLAPLLDVYEADEDVSIKQCLCIHFLFFFALRSYSWVLDVINTKTQCNTNKFGCLLFQVRQRRWTAALSGLLKMVCAIDRCGGRMRFTLILLFFSLLH